MIYISHSWTNKQVVRRLSEAFETDCIPFWVDEQQLAFGEELRSRLRAAISKSAVFLYLVSVEANDSKWVQDELDHALGLELNGRLKIIPVRMANNKDDLPPALTGRLYATLETADGGGLARLIQQLAEIPNHDNLPPGHWLSATVRLEKHRVVHTLDQARTLKGSSDGLRLRVALVDNNYEALDRIYYNLSQVQFPSVAGTQESLKQAQEQVDYVHAQSRKIIREVRSVCASYVSAQPDHTNRSYIDAGYVRAIRILLHELSWNVTYLSGLRNEVQLEEDFVRSRSLAYAFDGHVCDFVQDGEKIGSTAVPNNAHPWPHGMEELIPWGLSDPFRDMLPDDVGTAVGDILARRFLAGTIEAVTMPSSKALKYGLS